MWAFVTNKKEVVHLLLEAGADIYDRDHKVMSLPSLAIGPLFDFPFLCFIVASVFTGQSLPAAGKKGSTGMAD
jgi:hypothetical protein